MEEMNGDRVSQIIFGFCTQRDRHVYTQWRRSQCNRNKYRQGVNYEVKFQKRGAEQSKSVTNFKL